MHKVIHSKFELDLSNYKISFVEDNHWFSDQFFTKYSFPFSIYLIDDLIHELGILLDYNAAFLVTYFDVKYADGNKIESAILEIESQKGKILSATIRAGFDELPNWNKKLSELPLEETIITDIYAHAKTIISQTWPNVNYNFPQIHTDKYDTTEDTWQTFLKIINNYDGTNFLQNTFASENFANRNIIQPLPAFLHILTVLFADAGYTLKGTVTTNPLFQKMLLFTDLNNFSEINNSKQEVVVNVPDYTDSDNLQHYNQSITLSKNSIYTVRGLAMFNNYFNSTTNVPTVAITYRGAFIFLKYRVNSSSGTSYSYFDIDATFKTDDDDDEHVLTFFAISEVTTGARQIFGNIISTNPITYEGVKVEKQVTGLDAVPSEIHLLNEINLKKVVPNITGGTLITAIKNWFNIDLDIVGKDIYMNFIEDEMNYSNAENLTNFEELEPQLKHNNNKSFLLKFNDIENNEYSYEQVFQNRDVIEFSDKNVDGNTNTIVIGALPLPQKNIFGIETAYAVENGGDSKIYVVLYNGLNAAGLNLTEDSTPLKIPAIHENHYKKWFTFRIGAITFNWNFKMFSEKLNKIKKKVYAYKRFLVVKSINKTQISEDLYDVEIEADTLP